MLQPIMLEVSVEVWIVVLLILLVQMLYVGSRVKVVREGTQIVIERFGQYYTTWTPGIHFLVPFTDRIRKFTNLQGSVTNIVDQREQELCYSSKELYTKDNKGIQTSLTLFLQISDAKKYIYASDNTEKLISSLASKIFYNIIIEMELKEVLEGRNIITQKLKQMMDEALESWGITLNHVEISNIVSQ